MKMPDLRAASRWARWVLLALGGALALAACHQNGETFVVDTTADTADANPGDGACADAEGACSLRAAVMESNASAEVDEIVLDGSASYTLSIGGTGEDASATGDLDLVDAVVISGNGATVDGAGVDRVLDLRHASGLTEIVDLTLVGGTADSGSAIDTRGTSAFVSVSDTEITATSSSNGGPVHVDGATVWLRSSTIHDNVATNGGAVIVQDGAARIENTTIHENDVAYGAVLSIDGRTRVDFSTISGHGVGLRNLFGEVTATGVAMEGGCQGPIDSGGSNAHDGSFCFTDPSDQEVADLQLGPLADNGGPVPTRLPASTSPVLVGGPTSGCTTTQADARGVLRPQGAACDAGAVELEVDSCPTPQPGDDLSGADLSGCDFSGLDLTDVVLTDALVDGTDFSGATLTGVRTGGLRGTPVGLPEPWIFTPFDEDFGIYGIFWGPGADLTNVVLFPNDVGVTLNGAVLDGAVLSGATLDGLTLLDSSAVGADFAGASLDSTWFERTDASLASFAGASLGSIGGCPDFPGPRMIDSVLEGADLSDVTICNLTLDGTTLLDADVSGTDLSAGFGGISYTDVTCPDGTNSDANGGTCVGHE